MDVNFEPPLAVGAMQIAEGLTALWITFVTAWLFWLGGSVGSFLNVVVYRLPLGKNLSKPRSSCPVCGHEIRVRHNIPVLGWLVLRGRCYDCGTPISSRYPLVEAALGSAFLILGWELFRGGTNLHLFPGEMWSRMPWPELSGAYVLHAALVTTLIGAALIEFDGRAIPPSLFGPSLALGSALPLWFPSVRPLTTFSMLPAAYGAVLETVLGLAAGTVGGLLIAVLWEGLNVRRAPAGFAPVLVSTVIGLALGWQGLVITLPFAGLLFLAGILIARTRSGWMLPFPAAAALYLVALIPTFRSGWCCGVRPEDLEPLGYVSAFVGGLLMLGLAAKLAPDSYLQREPQSFPLQNVPPPAPAADLADPLDTGLQSIPPDTTHEL